MVAILPERDEDIIDYLYLCAIAVYYVHDKRVAGEIVNDVFVSFFKGRVQI